MLAELKMLRAKQRWDFRDKSHDGARAIQSPFSSSVENLQAAFTDADHIAFIFVVDLLQVFLRSSRSTSSSTSR
jgi:hypothetical protein